MAVAVQMPQRREERDFLDTVVKALGVASTIYGIKDAGTKAEALRAQVELAKQKGAREDQTQALDVEAKKLALRGQGAVEITDQNGNVSYEMPKKVSQTFLTTPDRGSVTAGKSDEEIAALAVPESAYVDQYGFAKPGMFGNQKKTLDQQKEEAGIAKTKAETDYILGGKGRDKDKAVAEASAKLRHERSESGVTKSTQRIAVSYNKILHAAENPSAAGDIAILYNTVKVLDENSAVKEGEIDLVKTAQGPAAMVLNYWNQVKNGKAALPPEVRADFVKQAQLAYLAQEQQQKQFDANLARIAQKSGVDPADVIIPFGLAESAPQEKRLTDKKPGFFDSLLGSQNSAANRTEISPEDARLELIRRKGIGKVPK